MLKLVGCMGRLVIEGWDQCIIASPLRFFLLVRGSGVLR